MPRTGENIFKRSDGRWEARYIHHYENGRAVYRYLYAKTYAQARAKKRDELLRPEAHRCTGQKQQAMFDDIVFLWLADKKCTVKESTFARYYRIIDKHLLPLLHGVKLIKTDERCFRGLTEKLMKSGANGLSPKSAADILCVLGAVLKYGHENGHPVPPGRCIKYPAKTQPNISVITNDELKRIKSALTGLQSTTGLGVIFTLYTGVRIGELCGLRWGNINFTDKTAKISRTVERIANLGESGAKTKVIVSEPKTQNSERVIPLTENLVEFLQNYRRADDFYILTGSRNFTEPHQYYVKYKKFLVENGMAPHSFHTLRHTFATGCVSVGMDTKSLSEILGHSSIETTLKFYVHPSLQQKRTQLERLTAVFSGASNTDANG